MFSSHCKNAIVFTNAPDGDDESNDDELDRVGEDSVSKNVTMGYTKFIQEFKKYNVGIYMPKTDTCVTCDTYKNQILNSSLNEDHKKEVEKNYEEHQMRNEAARNLLKQKESEAKAKADLLVFTFDLMSILPLPYSNNSVFFYKRQLSLYNLGISHRGKDICTCRTRLKANGEVLKYALFCGIFSARSLRTKKSSIFTVSRMAAQVKIGTKISSP